MEEQNSGKKLTTSAERGKKLQKSTPALVAGVVVGVLIVGYLGLCAVVGGNRVLPHTTVLGVDVSRMDIMQAEETLIEAIPQKLTAKTVKLKSDVGDVPLNGGELMECADLDELLTEATGGSFLTRGVRYLSAVVSKDRDLSPELRLTADGKVKLDTILDDLARRLGTQGNETTWTVGETDVVFSKGVTGAQINSAAARRGVEQAFAGEGPDTVEIVVTQAPPADPDFDGIAAEIHTEAADAYLDRESGEVVPSVIGRDLDVDAAKLALAATAEGKNCTVPLDLTRPALTTEAFNALLFRDVLGEAVTHVTGTSDRVGNIKNAASFVNNCVVFPDEEFSFSQHCSPYSMDNGYGKATAYVNGLSVDTVAGGICQASSTLYWASLKANLTTVERNAHRYEPTYIKGGLDATVYGNYGTQGSLDFRFKNSTTHPIKIEEYVDSSNYIHAIIRGTDETGVHGEPYCTNRVVTQEYKTIYEASSDVPKGIIKKDTERTGYTGANIDTYQKLVDKSGKTVSESKLYTSKYKVRNEVMLYNPADAETWGIDPDTGVRTTPAVAPAEVVATEPAAPSASDVGQSPAPAETQNAVESAQPSEEQPVVPPEEEPILPAVATQPPMEFFSPAPGNTEPGRLD